MNSATLFAVVSRVSATALWAAALAGFATLMGLASPLRAEEAIAQPILGLDSGGHTGWVTKLLVNPYGNELISVSHDKTIRFWDVETGKPIRVLHPPIGRGIEGRLYAAALSPSNRLLAVGGDSALTPAGDHRVLLISLPDGQIVRTLQGHSGPIRDLAFSPDGNRLASASDDLTARVWDPQTGETLHTLSGHKQRVNSVAWSPDGSRLLTGSWDGTARIWFMPQASRAKASVEVIAETTLAHGHHVMFAAWTRDGRMIATGGGTTIKLWNPNGSQRYVWNGLPLRLQTMSLSNDSTRLVYGWGSMNADYHGAAVLSLQTGAEISRYTATRNTPMDCIFVDGGHTVATGASSTEIVVWNGDNGRAIRWLAGGGGPIRSAAWSPEGRLIAWGYADTPGTAIHGTHPLEHSFDLERLKFGPRPDGSYRRAIATSGDLYIKRLKNRVAQVYRGGGAIATLQIHHHDDKIRCKTLLPGNRAALGTSYGVVVYNALNGQPIFQLPGHTDTVWAMAPSPDGRYLLTGGGDETLEIWNLETYQLTMSLFAAGDEWIAWTPQGYYAASLGGEYLMGWHVNRGPEAMADFYAASQFHDSLYRPDILKRLLKQGDPWKAREEADRVMQLQTEPIVLSAALPPRVTITSPAKAPGGSPAPNGLPALDRPPGSERSPAPNASYSADGSLRVTADAAPAGRDPVTTLRLLIDGRPAGVSEFATKDAANDHDDVTHANAGKSNPVRGEWNVRLSPGQHELVVKADTAKSYSLSEPVDVFGPVRQASEKAERPTLETEGGVPVAAGAGIEKSTGAGIEKDGPAIVDAKIEATTDAKIDAKRGADDAGLNLLAVGISEYRDPTARLKFAATDARAITERFGRERGRLFEQVNTRLLVDDEATRAGILAALAVLRETARPQDTTIVYFAGQAAVDSTGECRWLAFDSNVARSTPAAEATPASIGGGEIKTWAAATAGRVLVLLDIAPRGAVDGLQRELAGDNFGVAVISAAGATGDANAALSERSAFCELLLGGFSPAGDLNRDGVVMLDELETFLKRATMSPRSGAARPLTIQPRLVKPFPLARP